MNDKRKALGRGLETLLPGRSSSAAAIPAPEADPHEISVDLIDPNPYQTRHHVDEAALRELTDSIRNSGVVQPVIVRPSSGNRFQLVAGERRWMASKNAGKAKIPAIVRYISNEQAMEITIIENLQREDLNPVEQARAFERLSREFKLTQEQIATRTGMERATIANFMRLLKLPDQVLSFMESGELSFGHGKVLGALVGSPELLSKAVDEVVSKAYSVRQTEELIARLTNPESSEKEPAKQRPLDPNVREAARTLERALGVKVEIKDRKGKGKIILSYGSLEDFDRIVEALGEKK